MDYKNILLKCFSFYASVFIVGILSCLLYNYYQNKIGFYTACGIMCGGLGLLLFLCLSAMFSLLLDKEERKKIFFDDMIFNLSSQGSIAQVMEKGRELGFYSCENGTIRCVNINKIMDEAHNPYFAGGFFSSLLNSIPHEFLPPDKSSVLQNSLDALKTDDMTFKVFMAGVKSRHQKLADEIEKILKEKNQ